MDPPLTVASTMRMGRATKIRNAVVRRLSSPSGKSTARRTAYGGVTGCMCTPGLRSAVTLRGSALGQQLRGLVTLLGALLDAKQHLALHDEVRWLDEDRVREAGQAS